MKFFKKSIFSKPKAKDAVLSYCSTKVHLKLVNIISIHNKIIFLSNILFLPKLLLVEEKFKIKVWKQGLNEKIELPYFSSPKGKLEPGETEDSCAIREVEEETGFNIVGHYDPALYFEENYPNTLRYYLLIYVLAICIMYLYVCMYVCIYMY